MVTLLLLLLSPSVSALELHFLDSLHWAHSVDYQDGKIGGLSALSALPLHDYVVLSDDRSNLGPARAYILDIKLVHESQKLQVSVLSELPLKDAQGKNYAKNTIDPEGIAVLEDGTFLISSEGDTRPSPRIAPSVFATQKDGSFIKSLTVPEKFLPETTGTQTQGALNNEGFESLTLSPDFKNLFSLTESPLLQDGPASTFETGSLVRMIHWQQANPEPSADKQFNVMGEYAYPLSPTPKLFDSGALQGNNGVSEALALTHDSLLVLERAYVFNETQGRTSIRLYQADRTTGEDVSQKTSLKDQPVQAMEKKLIYNFDEAQPFLPSGHTIDNLEAMAWGPLTKDGNRTLIFVSDSNFSEKQETQFLIFEVKE